MLSPQEQEQSQRRLLGKGKGRKPPQALGDGTGATGHMGTAG